jgi:hypothetical protein
VPLQVLHTYWFIFLLQKIKGARLCRSGASDAQH